MMTNQTKSNKHKAIWIVLLVLIGCGLMAYVDAIWIPNFAIKSTIKVFLFLLLPTIYAYLDKDIKVTDLFQFDKKAIVPPLMLGIFVFLFILGAYFFLGPFFDFSNVTASLTSGVGVNANNFILVAIYISFINSLLEEFFFRGFAFLTLKKVAGNTVAMWFGAFSFALYHIAIMTNWFSIPLFLLLILALVIAGLLFQYLDESSKTIYPSWLVHMCANLAINVIGYLLFAMK